MNRKEFLEQIGLTTLIIPACLSVLSGCSKTNVVPAAPTNVDFTIDVSTGALAQNGGYLVRNGLIIARTTSGNFLAVSAACTHEGSTIEYIASKSDFYCPRHGATFNASGKVTAGPASQALSVYNTTLTGTSLRVFS
jgi:cytochrome b6-f complex iron-sulfur subunit